jgi:hypothetical protein
MRLTFCNVSLRMLVIMLAGMILLTGSKGCYFSEDSAGHAPEEFGNGGDYFNNPMLITKNGGPPAVAGTPNVNCIVLFIMNSVSITYYVGTADINNECVNWGSSSNWSTSGTTAMWPSVGLSDSLVLAAAYSEGDYSGNLTGNIYTAIGTVSGQHINFGSIEKFSGYYAATCITRDGTKAVLIYQSDKSGGSLYYRIGDINKGSNTANWGPAVYFTKGYFPSVAINDSNQVITVFNSYQNNNGLWYCSGTLNTQSNQIGFSGSISFGSAPKQGSSVALGNYADGGDYSPSGTSLLAIFPDNSVNGSYYYYQFGFMDIENSVQMYPAEVNNYWVVNPRVGKVYAGAIIEVFQYGNNLNELYYYFVY